LALTALSAFCLTVEPSCSIEAAVCCRALACCSVRVDRLWLPWAISELAVDTLIDPSRTPATRPERLWRMASMAATSEAISSLPRATSGRARLPWANSWVAAPASPSGPTMERVVR